MKKIKIVLSMLLMTSMSFVYAIPNPQVADQVSQLDQIVGLDKGQKQNIQKILEDTMEKTKKLQMEAEQLKQALGAEIVPDFDESSIRKNAEKLGKVSGELTAESALLQAKIQNVLTEKQRNVLIERALQPQSPQQAQPAQ